MRSKSMSALLVILALSIAFAANSGAASAAGQIGPYGQADVTCDYWTGIMTIKPRIGASPALSTQTIAWRYYFRTPGKNWSAPTAWLAMNHTARTAVNVNPFVPGGGGYMYEQYANTKSSTFRLPSGVKYEVKTEYAWLDGYWSYRSALTMGYTLTHYSIQGGSPYCYV